MNTAVVGIGSNIDPDLNIPRALELLGSAQELKAVSKLTATKPIGFTNQPDFVNGAALIRTSMNYELFVNYLKDIEKQLGRVREGDKYGPRTIDLDVIIWNGLIVGNDFFERRFVRDAVKELVPEFDE